MSDASIKSMTLNDSKDTPQGVEYARRLYADVLGWYHSADVKAQVLMGLNGAFLVFLATAVFQRPADLQEVTAKFSPWTWRLLGLMGATLIVSIGAACYCLWSRIYFAPSLEKLIAEAKAQERGQADRYPADVMWFFQHVAALEWPRFRNTFHHLDSKFEVDAMALQVEKLAGNVRKKHIAVDLGFVLSVATLLLFTLAAASYVVNLRSS
jgi:hypothetical protein